MKDYHLELKLRELHNKAMQKFKLGDFDSALSIANKIKKFAPHYLSSYIDSGLLIDIGGVLQNEKIVKEGISLLKKDFIEIISKKEHAPTAYYNLANGYYTLFSFKRHKDPHATLFKETELDQAKINYRKALEYNIENPLLSSQIWVNLGNCFDTLGRVVDALDCYEKALYLKPDHGMALGNKGLALYYFAGLSVKSQRTFLIESYFLIKRALELGVNREAVKPFEKYVKKIEKFFPNKEILKNQPLYPGYKIKAKSKFERFLIEYCLKNKLYLNICNCCQKCSHSIGDPEVIEKMIVSIKRNKNNDFLKYDPYIRLSSYLNQIKQDYITARFLLILSRYEGINLNFVDRRVKLIDTFDYSVHNIYIELVKASYKNFYNILDKIAFFIRDYLKLKINERFISFRSIWYSNFKNKIIRQKIRDTKNFSLNALYDMHKDFENGSYERLRKIRNALTHRFLKVKAFVDKEDNESVTEETLIEKTLELAELVRNAFIYLLQFVFVEENKKAKNSGDKILPLPAFEFPDKLKSWR